MNNMKTNNESNYVLIGLPHSGKSTFIAALWHIVESKELEGTLTIKGLPDDRTYLNKLRDTWLSFKDFERTKVEYKHHITLTVTNQSDDYISKLKFPDVSGEMYKIQFENRKLDLEYVNMIQTAKGIILFINPDHIIVPQLISSIDACIGNETNSNNTDIIKNWEYKFAPTQVVLVDLLQMIVQIITNPIKVAVVVSAWDVIKNTCDTNPLKWIEDNLPLLFQYLNSNESLLKYFYFGISAQGGNYSEQITELQSKSPSERIIVQTENETSNDITLPIKWLLNDE